MNKRQKVLIIGGDGFIASHLAEKLTAQTITAECYLTQRKDINGAWYFDLSDQPSVAGLVNKIRTEKILTVVVLAAITSNARCLENKPLSEQVNVINTQLLLQGLSALAVFSVFISSSQVFNHQSANIPCNQAYAPTTLYGEQKVKVEHYINAQQLNVAIVRLTKVIGTQFPLFKQVLDDAKTNKTTTLFNDYCAAPISINFACDAIMQIMLSRKAGLYQLSGAEDLSYYEMAKRLVKQLTLKANIIGVSSTTKNLRPCLYGSLLPCGADELTFKAQPFSQIIADYQVDNITRVQVNIANSASYYAEKGVNYNDGEQ
ncbi:MAG: sugar nucleotide-binding protein [Thalassotalea sp.]